MNNRALTLSLVMAVLAIVLVQSYVEEREEALKAKFGAEIAVVVAREDIGEMETITEKHLELKSVPKRFVEPTAISTAEGAGDEKGKAQNKLFQSLIGSVSLVPIKQGEQITTTKLSEPGVRTGLSPQITPGKRGISISVGEVTGVSKLVKPGDRVDVIAIVDPGQGKMNRLAKTVFQDVVVLSVGKSVTNNPSRSFEMEFGSKPKLKNLSSDTNFTTVTIELDPMQAQTIALLALGDSALVLSLRNNDDVERTNVFGVSLGDVLGADLTKIQNRGPAKQ